MGKIVVSENVTLDGVIQDPAGDEGFRAGLTRKWNLSWACGSGPWPSRAGQGLRVR